MPNVKDCPGFETFGADVQQAREAVKMSRRELAEKVGIDPRYLANTFSQTMQGLRIPP